MSAAAATEEFLTANKWPTGLRKNYLKNSTVTEKTFFLIDDSGSMTISDCHKFVKNGNKFVPVGCSRYSELVDCLTFHASLANSAKTHTVFRLLNNCAPIAVGGPGDDGTGYARLMQALDLPPSGGTPLCGHINAIVAEVTAMAPKLRADNKRVKLIIATDGEASDGDLAAAMAPLKSLPVWIVLRLCTQDEVSPT
jgi:hypothetical protein